MDNDIKNLMEIVSMNVKNGRKYKKLNQQQLANKIGVSRDLIAKIESGKHLPSLTLYKLAKALEYKTDEILEDNRLPI